MHATETCTAPNCNAAAAAGCCFECGARVCANHAVKVVPLAKKGTVETAIMCPGCFKSDDCWVPDCEAKQCFECSRTFTLFRRRHHCRICGQVFCGTCTSFKRDVKVKFPHDAVVSVRVCLPCQVGELDPSLRTRTPSIFNSRRSTYHAHVEADDKRGDDALGNIPSVSDVTTASTANQNWLPCARRPSTHELSQKPGSAYGTHHQGQVLTRDQTASSIAGGTSGKISDVNRADGAAMRRPAAGSGHDLSLANRDLITPSNVNPHQQQQQQQYRKSAF